MTGPYWLDPLQPELFPPTEMALTEPNGLLALGGDLSVERLLAAYRHGIFPWYSEGQPILWWSPDPRTVIYPQAMHISRSLHRRSHKRDYEITMDCAFREVIEACAAPRVKHPGTWILPEMIEAYVDLHQAGYAHSIELWQAQKLVGGLYGVSLGKVFFGESMFSRISNASKMVMAHLLKQLALWEFGIMDCQVESEHLLSLGAVSIPRSDFNQQLETLCQAPTRQGRWQCDTDLNEKLLNALKN